MKDLSEEIEIPKQSSGIWVFEYHFAFSVYLNFFIKWVILCLYVHVFEVGCLYFTYSEAQRLR